MRQSMVSIIRTSDTFSGIQFIETSALDASNVEQAFVRIINDIYQTTLREQQQQEYDSQHEEDNVNIRES